MLGIRSLVRNIPSKYHLQYSNKLITDIKRYNNSQTKDILLSNRTFSTTTVSPFHCKKVPQTSIKPTIISTRRYTTLSSRLRLLPSSYNSINKSSCLQHQRYFSQDRLSLTPPKPESPPREYLQRFVDRVIPIARGSYKLLKLSVIILVSLKMVDLMYQRYIYWWLNDPGRFNEFIKHHIIDSTLLDMSYDELKESAEILDLLLKAGESSDLSHSRIYDTYIHSIRVNILLKYRCDEIFKNELLKLEDDEMELRRNLRNYDYDLGNYTSKDIEVELERLNNNERLGKFHKWMGQAYRRPETTITAVQNLNTLLLLHSSDNMFTQQGEALDYEDYSYCILDLFKMQQFHRASSIDCIHHLDIVREDQQLVQLSKDTYLSYLYPHRNSK